MGNYLNHTCYNQTLLNKAIGIIEDNITNTKFNVDFFAREMCLGRTNLYYKIKGITGQAPNEFVINTRLKKSIEFLHKEPDLTVAEIAYRSGFNKPSYFIRCFKNLFGMTPKQYKQSLGK